ncbi:MBL fold metallo-hydrolase [Halocatena halophila]|uniref:MBL fold metallo-hydrolase n=1 Tax=Halocatena halophila TaxID=2814576 RepID=UPI002ED222AD
MDIVRIPVPVASAPTGSTNAYVIGAEEALLVDPPSECSALDVALERRTISHIAVTHHHPDHTGGVRAYAERTGATVWARYGRTASFEAATDCSPDRTFRTGTTIPTSAGGVRVIETPGHAPEHCGFTAGSTTLVGDLAIQNGSVGVAKPDGDLRAYLGSLRRIGQLAPEMLYPGHGPTIDAPVETCYRLYNHRRDRDSQILSAVAEGASTVEAITDMVYDTEGLELRTLAEGTVRSHLQKLAVEGQLSWDGSVATT